jgi:hypothetical protein
MPVSASFRDRRRARAFWLAATCLLVLVPAAARADGPYQFLSSPETDINRIYRVDTATGEVGACQYGLNPGKDDISPGFFGVTVCYPSGAGAGPQQAGTYALVASHHEREGGVFRVDLRSGAMSICYVYTPAPATNPTPAEAAGYVVCTPPSR